jgi:hypothetical protein
MIRFVICALLLAACADPHLGDIYGRRTRSALDAQRDAKTEGATLDADDAKLISAKHHSKPAPGTPGAQQAVPSMGSYGGGSSSYGGSSGSSSTGVPSSPQTGIRLDAAR